MSWTSHELVIIGEHRGPCTTRAYMEPECTLSIQNLPEWVTEAYLYRLFSPTQAVVSVKLSKMRSVGGGRVAYMVMSSAENAARCLQTYHGTSPPNVNLRLDLAWAAQTQPKFEGVRQ